MQGHLEQLCKITHREFLSNPGAPSDFFSLDILDCSLFSHSISANTVGPIFRIDSQLNSSPSLIMLPWAKQPSLLISIIAMASLLISLILFLPPYSLISIQKLEKSFEKFSAHNNSLLPQILQCIPTLFRVKANVITLVWKMILSNPLFCQLPSLKSTIHHLALLLTLEQASNLPTSWTWQEVFPIQCLSLRHLPAWRCPPLQIFVQMSVSLWAPSCLS